MTGDYTCCRWLRPRNTQHKEADWVFLHQPIPFGEPPVLYTGEFAYRSGFWAKAIGESDRRYFRSTERLFKL